MSRFSDRVKRIRPDMAMPAMRMVPQILVGLSWVLMGVTWAGSDGLMTSDADRADRKADAAVLSAQQVTAKTRSVLRCWQDGRLVYEVQDVTLVGHTTGTTELRSGSGGSIQVLDMRHGLCVVTNAAPSGSAGKP